MSRNRKTTADSGIRTERGMLGVRGRSPFDSLRSLRANLQNALRSEDWHPGHDLNVGPLD